MLRLRIKMGGHLNSVEEFLGVISGKFKAVSFFCGRVIMGDSVVQPTGGPHHRDRAIFQAIDLIETTRLIFRWHEEEI